VTSGYTPLGMRVALQMPPAVSKLTVKTTAPKYGRARVARLSIQGISQE
jgi:hypothetical protein